MYWEFHLSALEAGERSGFESEADGRFVLHRHKSALARITSPTAKRDAKSHLQELVQNRLARRPHYSITNISGPPHDRTFTAVVALDGEVVGTGIGRSKKEAERRAAAQALEEMDVAMWIQRLRGGEDDDDSAVDVEEADA